LVTESLSIGYTPGNPLVEGLNLSIRAGQRIGLTGSIGSGKTTLIRTIAGKLPPLAGRIQLGTTIKLGYMAQEQELLNPRFNALQTIQSVASFNETETRNFLHYFLFKGDDALRPTSELSFGERARLQLELSSRRDARSFCSMNPSTTSTYRHGHTLKKRLSTSKVRPWLSSMTAIFSNALHLIYGM